MVQKLLSAGQMTGGEHLLPAANGTIPLVTVVCHSSGINVNMVDQKGLTALDVVKEMPSQKSREIAALILGEN